MKNTAIAIALSLGLGTTTMASAGLAGLQGVGTGSYTFTLYDGSGGIVGGSTSQPWSFDFNNGTAVISNSQPFFGFAWTAHDITFVDNGNGTYSGDMLFDWNLNYDIPVSILWDIDLTSVTTLDGDSDGIIGNAMIAGPFPGFSAVFNGTLTGQYVVPIPAAVWLFGSGLLGLIGIARRKRAT